MDAVLFELKRGHLSATRIARRALRAFELTPARFDLMNAIGRRGARQCDLWRRLNVVRSVVSEMVGALLELRWVKRVRAADGRTWLVSLTRRGREVFERAYDRWVESGDVAVYVDAVLVDRQFEVDPGRHRIELITRMANFIEELGWDLRRGRSLYPWDPEDYYDRFADMEPPWTCGRVPYVT
jgi:DNA-binding MarR family transcriptional regulator